MAENLARASGFRHVGGLQKNLAIGETESRWRG
jgi:hypothetical protein